MANPDHRVNFVLGNKRQVIRLTVGNSYSRLEGMTDQEFTEIRKLCSYLPDAASSYFGGGGRGHRQVRHLVSKRGEFPSGLIPHVKEWLADKPHTVKDDRTVPKASSSLYTFSLPVTPYDLQVKAVDACIASPEGRGTISAVTGFGKSIMLAMLINRLQVPALVIVPNLGLKEQLSASLKEYFGASAKHITVENIDSNRLNNLKNFGALIIDEAHHGAAKTYRQLNKKAWGDIYYRFSFTATPFRSREEEQILMESITSKVLYEITYHQAVAHKAIVPVEAYYVDLPKEATKGFTWPEVYSERVVRNKHRNDVIFQLLMTLHSSGASTLCLVKEIAHGNALSNQNVFPFANGQDELTGEMITRFNSGTLKTLIGTTGVLGEGVDTKPAEYVLICGLGKSKVQLMQQCGRAVRRYKDKESAKIIIFRDPSHKYCLTHFAAQVKVLKDMYGVKPVKLEI